MKWCIKASRTRRSRVIVLNVMIRCEKWLNFDLWGGHPIRSRSARARTFGGQNLATSVLAPKSSRQSSPRHVLHKPNQFWAFFISNSERFDNTLIKFELLGRIEWKKSKLQISNAKPKLNANQEWYTHFAEVPGLSARFTVFFWGTRS